MISLKTNKNAFKNLQDKDGAYIFGLIVGVVVVAFLALAFQTWILGIILSWFGIVLGFWKNFLIVLFVNMLVGSSK